MQTVERRRWLIGGALIAVFVVVAGWITVMNARPRPIAVGEGVVARPLDAHSRVRLAHIDAHTVRYAVDAGRVRIITPPASLRAVQVEANGVELKVPGAIFVVEVDGARAAVEVEQGTVRVVDGDGRIDVTEGQRRVLTGG